MNLSDNSIKNIYESWNDETNDYFYDNPNELTKAIDLEHLFHYDNVKNLDTLPCLDFSYSTYKSANVDLLDNVLYVFKPGKSRLLKVRLNKDTDVLGIVTAIEDSSGQDFFERAKLTTIEPDKIGYYLLELHQDSQGNNVVKKSLVTEVPLAHKDEPIPLLSDNNTEEENRNAFFNAFYGVKDVKFPTQQESEGTPNPSIEYNTIHAGQIRLTHQSDNNELYTEDVLMSGMPYPGQNNMVVLTSPVIVGNNLRVLATAATINNSGVVEIEDFIEFSLGTPSAASKQDVSLMFEEHGIYSIHKDETNKVKYVVTDIHTSVEAGDIITHYIVEATNYGSSSIGSKNFMLYLYEDPEDYGNTSEAIGDATCFGGIEPGETTELDFAVGVGDTRNTGLYAEFHFVDSPK